MGCMHYGRCHGCGTPIVIEEEMGWYPLPYRGGGAGWRHRRMARPTKEEERQELREHLADVREELAEIEKRLAELEA